MADNRKAGIEQIVAPLACGVGMGFLGGIALGGVSPDWSYRDVLLGPAVGAALALLVIVLHDKTVLLTCVLAFLGGLAGKLPMQNAKENLLKVNLIMHEKRIQEEIVQFKEVPFERQRAASTSIVEEFGKLMSDAATLKDKHTAESIGERLATSLGFLTHDVEKNPEMSLRGLGKLRKSAAESRNRPVWLSATRSLEDAATKTPDAGIRNRARNILDETKSPFDQEPR